MLRNRRLEAIASRLEAIIGHRYWVGGHLEAVQSGEVSSTAPECPRKGIGDQPVVYHPVGLLFFMKLALIYWLTVLWIF